MQITLLEAGEYFRGLLLLMRKDRRITQAEIDLMKRIGRTLGFEQEFCNNAIGEILENRFIRDEVPAFGSRELAVRFIRDGLALGLSDGELHPREELWLRATAEKHRISEEDFLRERAHAVQRNAVPERLEVEEITVRIF